MTGSSPAWSLQALFEAHRDEIIRAWNVQVQALPQFRSVAPSESRANVVRCFDAFHARIARQDSQPLEQFVRDLAEQRFTAGFEIHGPLSAASRFRVAVHEVSRAIQGEHSSSGVAPSLSLAVDEEIDAFNREFSAAFARLLVEDSASRLRELFDDASDVLMRVSPEGEILEVNDRVRALFGFSCEAWRERPWASIFVESEDHGEDLLGRIFAGQTVHAVFVDVRTAAHTTMRCALSGHRSRTSAPAEAVVVLRDVSEQEALRAQVLQSEKLASIGQLSATVAHELNNPLAWVLSNLEYIQTLLGRRSKVGDKRDSTLDEAIQDALAGVERMTDIVADLSDFARTERGDALPVDINKVIELALRISDTQIGHRVHVKRDYGELPPIRGHAGRLSQVFLNLFVNSAQAMVRLDRSENQILIRTRAQPQAVVVEVIDSGPGIPANQLDSLFAPFMSTKGKGGTGLGLWVCRNIVEEHGGELSLIEGRGPGAHFRISFPIAHGLSAPEDQ